MARFLTKYINPGIALRKMFFAGYTFSFDQLKSGFCQINPEFVYRIKIIDRHLFFFGTKFVCDDALNFDA